MADLAAEDGGPRSALPPTKLRILSGTLKFNLVWGGLTGRQILSLEIYIAAGSNPALHHRNPCGAAFMSAKSKINFNFNLHTTTFHHHRSPPSLTPKPLNTSL